MIVAGIDPGTKGAAAVIDSLSCSRLHCYSWDEMHPLNVARLCEWLESYAVTHVALEKAQSMPKQGVASTFKYGVVYGRLTGMLELMKVEYALVRPQEWKKHHRITADKSEALSLARTKWPVDGAVLLQRVKDQHRAEAALIADWYINRGDK